MWSCPCSLSNQTHWCEWVCQGEQEGEEAREKFVGKMSFEEIGGTWEGTAQEIEKRKMRTAWYNEGQHKKEAILSNGTERLVKADLVTGEIQAKAMSVGNIYWAPPMCQTLKMSCSLFFSTAFRGKAVSLLLSSSCYRWVNWDRGPEQSHTTSMQQIKDNSALTDFWVQSRSHFWSPVVARKEIMYVDASLETFISEIRRVDFTKGMTQSLKKVVVGLYFCF